MKNKGILIAIAIIVVAALVGVFVFLYLKDPDILTRSPSEIISGNVNGGEIPVGSNGESPSVGNDSLDPQGDCLITSSDNCKFASFFYRSDGSPVYGELYFLGFPEGMTLYAPMSGYVTVTRGTIMGVDHTTIRIAESADGPLEWDSFGPKTGGFISFIAREIEFLGVDTKNDALYVEKGEPFAKVAKKGEVFPGNFEEKPELLVAINRRWMEMLDVSTKDPREFIKRAVESMN
jgi:hypothetical protein